MSDEKKDVTDEQLEDVSGGMEIVEIDSDLNSPDDTGPSEDPRPVGRPGSW